MTGLAFFRVVASITNLSTYWSLSRHKGTKKSDVARLAPQGASWEEGLYAMRLAPLRVCLPGCGEYGLATSSSDVAEILKGLNLEVYKPQRETETVLVGDTLDY